MSPPRTTHPWLSVATKFARTASTSPRKCLAMLDRLRAVLAAQVAFHDCELGHFVAAFGPLAVEARGRVRLGDRVSFWPGMLRTQISCAEGGELVIGPHSAFNYGSWLTARAYVRIGARCMFGSLVSIDDERSARGVGIVIEDDVWIGHGAKIAGGARIGARSVVGANAFVDFAVPADTLVSGSPARCTPLA